MGQFTASVMPATQRLVTSRPSRLRRHPLQVALFTVDAALVTLSCLAGLSLRTQLTIFGPSSDVPELIAPIMALFIAIWLFTLWATGAYRERLLGAGTSEYSVVARAGLLTAALIGITAYLADYPLSRAFFFLAFLIGIPTVLLGRFLMRRLLHAARRRGLLRRTVIIAGDPQRIDGLAAVLRREPWIGYDVVGALTHENNAVLESVLPVLGSPQETLRVVQQTQAMAVIFVEGSFRQSQDFNRLARELERENSQLVVVPSLAEISSTRVEMQTIAGIPLLTIAKPQAANASRWVKRSFDIVATSLALVLTAPLMLVTVIAIKLEDQGPILFRQVRVGKDGILFHCLKLRSMVTNADELKEGMPTHDGHGPLFKLKHDPRVTKVGGFIRRYSIDELPQLWNVLRGEMSLVGPRPALQAEVNRYQDHVSRRLAVRPGLTGLWQVSGRSDLSWDDAVRLDLYYVDNWSFVQDLAILVRTVQAVFSSRGAY